MEGWAGLFGEACVALPTIFDKAGDPEARSNKLKGDRRQRSLVELYHIIVCNDVTQTSE